jgi:hypothetical protein
MEVSLRFRSIKRQLKKKCYRKNIIASSSQLLKLLMALIKERRPYAFRKETVKELAKLEMKYSEMQKKQKKEAVRKAA